MAFSCRQDNKILDNDLHQMRFLGEGKCLCSWRSIWVHVLYSYYFYNFFDGLFHIMRIISLIISVLSSLQIMNKFNAIKIIIPRLQYYLWKNQHLEEARNKNGILPRQHKSEFRILLQSPTEDSVITFCY